MQQQELQQPPPTLMLLRLYLAEVARCAWERLEERSLLAFVY